MVTINKYNETKDGYLSIRNVTFEADGLSSPKDWTYVKRGQFVVALVYNRKKNVFLFVKQYRIPLWENREQPFILEAPAGLHDQSTHEKTLIKEIKEELGVEDYIVEVVDIGRLYTSPGLTCELGYSYYVVVDTDESPVQFGGVEDEGEYIERIELSVEDTLYLLKRNLIADAKTQLLLYWWLSNVAEVDMIKWYRSIS